MEKWDSYNVACFVVTILVNILSFVVLFFYQRRKHRNIKIILFNLFLIHILFAVNQITSVFFNNSKSSKIIAGSRDVAAFLLLVYSLNLDILALQCMVNATRTLKDALEKKMQNLTIIGVLGCWFIPVIIALPLILLQVKDGGPISDELETYFQIILLVALVNLILVLVSNVYIAFRTWIKIDPNNIINFTVNRKNVTMTTITTVLYAISRVPYIAFHLGMRLPASAVNATLWFDKIGVPVSFFVIYCAKDLYQTLERLIRNTRQREFFRRMADDNNNNITVINSFTHVQPVVLPPDESESQPGYVLSTSSSKDCIHLEESQSTCV